jgi:phenylalanyl-tRNA synthetase beta chain
MKFSLEWLSSYLPGEPVDPSRLADRLTAVGFIVEGTEGQGASTVYDVEITANRPDGMNHRGLAREAAVALSRGFADPEAARTVPEGTRPAASLVRVVIEEPSLCSRYSARVLEGLRVGPADARVRARLEAIGSNPISAPVDATNHVLWDIGQPLHAFDLDKLAHGEGGLPAIIVRRGRPGETLVTLDGLTRTLSPEHLVIADAERAIALAGVMGGLDTAISGATTRILLESAHFAPSVVRRTARSLGMHTDASHRFERGTDRGTTVEGLARAARLIQAGCGGTIAAGVVDAAGDVPPIQTLVLSHERLVRFLGLDVPLARCEAVLYALGFAPRRDGKILSVSVPSWRVDVESEVDLIEEVIRCEGYDLLPETLPRLEQPGKGSAGARLEDRVRDVLAGAGLMECQTYSFISAEENRPFESAASRAPVVIENPLGEPFTTMRATPVAGLLKAAQHNVRRGHRDLALFEVGRSFGRNGPAIVERPSVALLLAGRVGVHWSAEARDTDFFDGSGFVAALALGLGAPGPVLEPESMSFLAPGRSARVKSRSGVPLGWVGILSPALAAAWDLRDPVVAHVDLGLLFETIPPPSSSAALPPRFPGSEVDLTVTHPLTMSWGTLERTVRSAAPPELLSVEAKGRYRGPGVPEGFVKTTLTLRFGSAERSLSREEVNAWRDAAAGALLGLSETKVDGLRAQEGDTA